MNSKAWKMSASVIMALRSPAMRDSVSKVEATVRRSQIGRNNTDQSNVQILSLRRGQSDKHLPGIHVFPGGHFEDADTSISWIDLYRSLGFEESSFESLATGGGVDQLPEYNETNPTCLPGWMSLRLCAIRETFEETGILLCRSPCSIEQCLPYASFATVNDLPAWQSRVRADPRQMLTLCDTVSCVPDIWGLHLWSNWLTPTQQKVRHNSVFFLAVLHSLPAYSLDVTEMDELMCCSASDLMNLTHAGKIRLANPQYYEAARLLNFTDADSLASFAAKRAVSGCGRVMPVQEKTKDGMLFILPGDSAYPRNVDYETSSKLITKLDSFKELREKENVDVLHRVEVPAGNSCQRIVVKNYEPPYQHILPINFSVGEFRSQL